MTSHTIQSIDIQNRDMSVNPRKLRREGRIPATLYGKGQDAVSIDLDKKTFTHLYYTQNPNLITLNRNGDKLNAMVKTVHLEPLTGEIINIEFLQVKADQKVKLSVPVLLENESPAVKTGGVLLQLLDEVEIECLPGDIPDNITYDLSKVTDVGITVTIGDMVWPGKVHPVLAADVPVFNVAAPKTAAEEGATEGTEGELTVTPQVAAEIS